MINILLRDILYSFYQHELLKLQVEDDIGYHFYIEHANNLNEHSKKCGTETSLDKAKVMTLIGPIHLEVELDGQDLDQVNELVRLGLTATKTATSEI